MIFFKKTIKKVNQLSIAYEHIKEDCVQVGLKHDQLRLEHDQLRLEHDQLRLEHDQLRLEHDQLRSASSLAHIAVHAAFAHDGIDIQHASYLKHYFSSQYSLDNETWNIMWLVAITQLIIDGNTIFAEKLLNLYIMKFGRRDLTSFALVCQLAMGSKMGDAETDRIAKMYASVRKIRCEQRFEKLIKNAKSVAIVGRSHILFGKHLGAEIDAHDLVIRFNNTHTTQDWVSGKFTNDYGSNTHVNFINRHNTIDPNVLNIYKDFRTFFTYPDVTNDIIENIDNNIDVLDFGMREHIFCESCIDDPTSGAIMIMWVKEILGSLRNVDIYAFNFQSTQQESLVHFDGTDFDMVHNMDVEIAMLRNIVGDYKNKKDVER